MRMRQMDRQTDGQADRQTGKETDRQRGRQTDRQRTGREIRCRAGVLFDLFVSYFNHLILSVLPHSRLHLFIYLFDGEIRPSSTIPSHSFHLEAAMKLKLKMIEIYNLLGIRVCFVFFLFFSFFLIFNKINPLSYFYFLIYNFFTSQS